jgi:O-antigen ligase
VSTNRPASPRPSSRKPSAARRPPAGRTPDREPSATRRSAEQRSAAPLFYLRQLPSWLPPIVLAALLVAGLAVRGWAGAAALLVVAAFLSWLAFLSWPRLTAWGRLGRAAAIALLLGLAVVQATR